MKTGIHPEYTDANITCACGASFDTHSTNGSFKVDICKECHPFYTGKQRMVDTAGRVDRYRRKFAKHLALKEEAAEAAKAKEAAATEEAAN